MKSVYTGSEKVAEFESYDELRVGENKPAFIYEGNEIVYPNPVKDGLVLWYDFSGRTNADGQRGIAEDLSGNGNHGTLQNFNYTIESGYDKNKLLFDGVDDNIIIPSVFSGTNSYSLSICFKLLSPPTQHSGIFMFSGGIGRIWFRIFNKYTLGFNAYFGTGMDYSRTFKVINTGYMIHVTAVIDRANNTIKLYYDGEEVSVTDISAAKDINWSNGDYANTSFLPSYMPSNAEYYDMKIYNRPLTPEEIAHNYAIEKERFGIE